MIWNVAAILCIARTSWTCGLAYGFGGTLDIIAISDTTYSFDHDKLISISQLIKEKLRDLQKLLKYFNRATTSMSNILLSFCLIPINFVLYLKDLLVIALLLLVLLLASLFSFALSLLLSL